MPKFYKHLCRAASLANKPLDWLLPQRCFVCSKPLKKKTIGCCDGCYLGLPFQSNCCPQCGQNLGAFESTCGKCIQSPPPFDACLSAFKYEAPISQLIHRFKYSNHPQYAAQLAHLLCLELFARNAALPQLIIPVPLHRSKLEQRGYNQATLLAKHIAKRLEVPYSINTVIKHKNTATQASLNLKQRQSNTRGAYSIAKPLAATHIALIDDVYTTGATAAEISRTLKRHGAQTVQVWAIAHSE